MIEPAARYVIAFCRRALEGFESRRRRMLLGEFGPGARLDRTVIVRSPGRVTVGAGVSIADFVHIWGGGGVEIGANTLIAAGTVISSQSHDINALASGSLYRDTNKPQQVVIGSNVWVGSNATILPGVTIGDGAVIAAGAVVNRDVPARTLVAGVPAKVIRTLA